MSSGQIEPKIDASAYVSPGCRVMGDVRLGPRASVWFGSVLRGDINSIEVGEGTNIQDLCLLHVTEEHPCRVGAWVTVGHRVILHGCAVEDRCLIGMGAIVLDGAVIGEGSMIGAGSVVTEGTTIPRGSLVLGVPGRVVRPLEEGQRPGERIARDYLGYALQHRKGRYPLDEPPSKEGKKE